MTDSPTRRLLAPLPLGLVLAMLPSQTRAEADRPEPSSLIVAAARMVSDSTTPTSQGAEEVEVTDFATEEAKSDHESSQAKAHAGAGGGGFGNLGFKLFLDLLADYRLNQDKWVFRPNHFYAVVQGNIKDDVGIMLHISENPVFYEVTWNLTPTFSIKAGKLLIPFGTNEFHHLLGGRVDEESRFLPETWGDFGVGVNHLVYDGQSLSLEYSAYAVNGFEGTEAPIIGAGDAADNNMGKALGGRAKLGLAGLVLATGSIYWDRWDPQDRYSVVFYSAGLELRPGIVDLPILKRLRIRGEWSRGEIQLPHHNYQTGVLPHFAYARAAYFGEMLIPVHELVALRARVGRINPDNAVKNEVGDNSVYEPAILFITSKITYTVAYQFVTHSGSPYRQRNPGDVVYAKFYLQY
jgi:hypothetical protein